MAEGAEHTIIEPDIKRSEVISAFSVADITLRTLLARLAEYGEVPDRLHDIATAIALVRRSALIFDGEWTGK